MSLNVITVPDSGGGGISVGLEKRLSEPVCVAGFPLQHAQSLQWSSTPQGLVSEPGECTNTHTYTRTRPLTLKHYQVYGFKNTTGWN